MFRASPQRFILVDVLKNFRPHKPDDKLESKQGHERQREEDDIDAPMQPIIAAKQGDERSQQQDGHGKDGDFQGQDDVRPGKHSLILQIRSVGGFRHEFHAGARGGS